MHPKRLEQILEGSLCTGCGLCASILGPQRAGMALDSSGYMRPVLLQAPSRDEDRLIAAVCPGAGLVLDTPEPHPLWGTVRSIQRGFARDADLRFRASSGGAISAIVSDLLRSGQCDYVLHVGADRRSPWLVELGESRGPEAVGQRAGSRYITSSPLADIVQRLDGDERFAIVAKPCDIAGLRMYARRDPRVAQKVVAMISFMCGGVPSARGAEALLARMGAPKDQVVAFRYRGQGWPGLACAELADGSSRTMSYNESWGKVLNAHLQFRCKICPDGMGAFADIVCADAWVESEDGYPSFEEADGRSVVIARTEIGQRILGSATRNGALGTEPMELSELDGMQPFQARRKRLTPSRLAAMLLAGRRIPRYEGLKLIAPAFGIGLADNLRSFLGMFRRLLTGRAD